MNELNDSAKPLTKIYDLKAIRIGTFLGGPLAGGYYIAENFKTFGDHASARKTSIITIIFTCLLLGILFGIPNLEKFPKYIIPLIYTVGAYYFVKDKQGAQINNHIRAGGETYKWRTASVALISLVIVLASGVLLGILTDRTTSQYYGSLKHEIMFDAGNISGTQVDELAGKLTEVGFFDDVTQQFIYADKEGETLIVVFPLRKETAKDPEVDAMLAQLQKDLQGTFPDRKIMVAISTETDPENLVRKFE